MNPQTGILDGSLSPGAIIPGFRHLPKQSKPLEQTSFIQNNITPIRYIFSFSFVIYSYPSSSGSPCIEIYRFTYPVLDSWLIPVNNFIFSHYFAHFLIYLSFCYDSLPFSISNTESATFMVDSLWDTRTTVFPFDSSCSDFIIMPSFKESRLLVGSSRSINGAS